MRLSAFFNLPVKNLTLSAAILATSTFLSAVLGVVRDRLLASRFGAGPQLDIYVASFRIPDLVYNLLVAGVLAVAILPVFAERFQRDREEAWRVLNNFFNLFLLALVGVCLLFFLITPQLIKYIVPGFTSEQARLSIWLTRLLFLSPIFFGGVGLFSGLLQYFNKFVVLAVSPLLYNLGIISGILFLAPSFGIFGVGLGVVAGAFFYFLVQVWASLKCGFSWKPVLSLKEPNLVRILRLMIPRFVAAAGQQMNILATTAIASMLGSGAISVFYFSSNLQSFVISFVGISFATVAFAALTKSAADSDFSRFRQDFSSAFWKVMFSSLVLGLLLFLFRRLGVVLLLWTGKFSLEALELTSAAVGIFALSIFAQAEIPLLLRAFFSLQEAIKPTVIVLASMVLNIVLSFGLVKWLTLDYGFRLLLSRFGASLVNPGFALLGLPLAFSLASLFQFSLLLFFLKRQLRRYGTN